MANSDIAEARNAEELDGYAGWNWLDRPFNIGAWRGAERPSRDLRYRQAVKG